MPWLPFKLRDADVWAKVDDRGEPIADRDGRVDVIYKAAPGTKVYRAAARNLIKRDGPAVEIEAGERAPDRSKQGPPAAPADATQVWSDGGARPNPGPAGIGVVVIEGGTRRELSEFLGHGTNQIAELTAMLRGLELVADRSRTVVVHSDSAYAIGLVSQGWKAKANVELVAELRRVAAGFADLRFVKVLGHSGVTENERCDQLVAQAIATRARHATGT
jgi:ribonuclease HI